VAGIQQPTHGGTDGLEFIEAAFLDELGFQLGHELGRGIQRPEWGKCPTGWAQRYGSLRPPGGLNVNRP